LFGSDAAPDSVSWFSISPRSNHKSPTSNKHVVYNILQHLTTMLMWHMCLSFLLRHWVPRGQPKLVSSCAVYHPSGQLHQWGRLHPVKKGRWLSPSAQLRTLHHFGGSFGHTQHSREIWNGHVDKNVTSSTDQQSSNVRKRQRAKQDRWYLAFPQILKGSTSYFKRRRGKQNLFYAIYLYIYIYNILQYYLKNFGLGTWFVSGPKNCHFKREMMINPNGWMFCRNFEHNSRLVLLAASH
jgi:hypothetical protein